MVEQTMLDLADRGAGWVLVVVMPSSVRLALGTKPWTEPWTGKKSATRSAEFPTSATSETRTWTAPAAGVDVDCPPGAATAGATTQRAPRVNACSPGGQAVQTTPCPQP